LRQICSLNAAFQTAPEAAMHLTVRSNHAMRLMMYCALSERRVTPVCEIARACDISEAHLAKIANRLACHGFVETVRGRGGGVRIARSPDRIKVGDVVRATETDDFQSDGDPARVSPLAAACRFPGLVEQALAAFMAVLDSATIADLVVDRDTLRKLMGLTAPNSPGARRAHGAQAARAQAERAAPRSPLPTA
jgi:Rrf2 family nitric oxide-sensitive transcriptional repressor